MLWHLRGFSFVQMSAAFKFLLRAHQIRSLDPRLQISPESREPLSRQLAAAVPVEAAHAPAGVKGPAELDR